MTGGVTTLSVGCNSNYDSNTAADYRLSEYRGLRPRHRSWCVVSDLNIV